MITNKAYEFNVQSDLPWLQHIICEPAGRNTAPAIALAMRYAIQKLGCSDDEILFVSPSDHLIEPTERFLEYLLLSEEIARDGKLVTFGIRPIRPETGYGYIKADTGCPLAGGRAYGVAEFVEKPNLKKAEHFLSEGNYYWNSGMFAFSVGAMRKELFSHAPRIRTMFDLGFDEMIASFEQMPSLSIDYAVMEKSANVAIVPAELQWNDIGSWDGLFGTGFPENQNSISIDSQGTHIIGSERVVAAIGLEDCIIVDTADALLVVKKGSGQKAKDVMERLTESGRKEALEHVTTLRPWGSFTNMQEAQGYKVKKIRVNPKEKLSLQFHHHRSEHWVVVKGRAKVTVGGREEILGENQSTFIPVLARHRLENVESTPIEIIEIQYGEYLGEDDITRIEDVYGRIG